MLYFLSFKACYCAMSATGEYNARRCKHGTQPELEIRELGAGAGAGQLAKATKKLAKAPFSRTRHFPHGVKYVTDKALMASYTTRKYIFFCSF